MSMRSMYDWLDASGISCTLGFRSAVRGVVVACRSILARVPCI